jgi:hypothetical protein
MSRYHFQTGLPAPRWLITLAMERNLSNHLCNLTICSVPQTECICYNEGIQQRMVLVKTSAERGLNYELYNKWPFLLIHVPFGLVLGFYQQTLRPNTVPWIKNFTKHCYSTQGIITSVCCLMFLISAYLQCMVSQTKNFFIWCTQLWEFNQRILHPTS